MFCVCFEKCKLTVFLLSSDSRIDRVRFNKRIDRIYLETNGYFTFRVQSF